MKTLYWDFNDANGAVMKDLFSYRSIHVEGSRIVFLPKNTNFTETVSLDTPEIARNAYNAMRAAMAAELAK